MKLPHSVQRSLSFLPLHLDNADVNSGEAPTERRVAVWKNLLPQVPHHLVLGKGLGVDAHGRAISQGGSNQGNDHVAEAIATGDFHNGPISLLLPFGLPGVIGFVWFLAAAGRVLYLNYKSGDPALLQINRCLLALFITKTVMFVFVFGSFYCDLVYFVGFVGLSIALNGGAGKSNEEQPLPSPALQKDLKLANG